MYGHGLPCDTSVSDEATLEGDVAEIGRSLEPFQALIDVTKAIALAPNRYDEIELTLVVLDEDGEPMPHETFQFDRASLQAR